MVEIVLEFLHDVVSRNLHKFSPNFRSEIIQDFFLLRILPAFLSGYNSGFTSKSHLLSEDSAEELLLEALLELIMDFVSPEYLLGNTQKFFSYLCKLVYSRSYL